MKSKELEARTKSFAIAVLAFLKSFERDAASNVISHQLAKSATSIGANYREANHAATHREFTHKVGIVEKETAESQYWLELCIEGEYGNGERAQTLLVEAGELLAIFISIGRTAKQRAGTCSEADTPYVEDEP